MNRWCVVLTLLVAAFVSLPTRAAAPSCASASASCDASCNRFKADARLGQCAAACQRAADQAAQCDVTPASTTIATPPARAYTKKGDALRERELNGKMVKAIRESDLRDIRRLIEMKQGLDPTYVYDYDYDPNTQRYEGRAVKLRLADLFKDVAPARRDQEGLDKILELFIELGMNVTATLPAGDDATEQRTAWGPSLVFMERAKDREARMRAFDVALAKGLLPNGDVGDWLFAELPEVCGRDRSQFAIQVVDMLVKHLGASLQDDFWRVSERGPESIADVLDRMMSPGTIPRSNFERTQFEQMDAAWENCSMLSRRINRYLIEAK